MPHPPEDKSTKKLVEADDVFELSSGITVHQNRTPSYPGADYPESIFFDITQLEPGSDWEMVGLKVGDTILGADRLVFGRLSLDERLALIDDPLAELNVVIFDEYGNYSANFRLDDALLDGLPQRPNVHWPQDVPKEFKPADPTEFGLEPLAEDRMRDDE